LRSPGSSWPMSMLSSSALPRRSASLSTVALPARRVGAGGAGGRRGARQLHRGWWRGGRAGAALLSRAGQPGARAAYRPVGRAGPPPGPGPPPTDVHQLADVVHHRGYVRLDGVLDALGGHHELLRDHVCHAGDGLALLVHRPHQQPERRRLACGGRGPAGLVSARCTRSPPLPPSPGWRTPQRGPESAPRQPALQPPPPAAAADRCGHAAAAAPAAAALQSAAPDSSASDEVVHCRSLMGALPRSSARWTRKSSVISAPLSRLSSGLFGAVTMHAVSWLGVSSVLSGHSCGRRAREGEMGVSRGPAGGAAAGPAPACPPGLAPSFAPLRRPASPACPAGAHLLVLLAVQHADLQLHVRRQARLHALACAGGGKGWGGGEPCRPPARRHGSAAGGWHARAAGTHALALHRGPRAWLGQGPRGGAGGRAGGAHRGR
jgi:hypothetical protein